MGSKIERWVKRMADIADELPAELAFPKKGLGPRIGINRYAKLSVLARHLASNRNAVAEELLERAIDEAWDVVLARASELGNISRHRYVDEAGNVVSGRETVDPEETDLFLHEELDRELSKLMKEHVEQATSDEALHAVLEAGKQRLDREAE